MTKKNGHPRPGIFSESVFSKCVFSSNIFSDRPDPDSLEGLQLTINEKSDETLECTRRMREMCAEAKDAGMKTLIALDDQEVNLPFSSLDQCSQWILWQPKVLSPDRRNSNAFQENL